MQRLWETTKKGYLRLIEPVAGLLIALRVSPNLLTTIGTLCTVAAGFAFGLGHVMTAGWIIAVTAIFDVLDGTVARRTGQSTVFGAFYDSTLDRVADGFLLGGLAWFFATSPEYASAPMLAISLAGMIGTFLVSYTRARAESLGLDAKVGVMQRPERVVLLAAPQALFGLALDGWVLMAVVAILAVTAWITAVQRILFVRANATGIPPVPLRLANDKKSPAGSRFPRRAQS